MNDKNFIINLTHDLKTPMNSIIGYTDLALSIENNDKVKEYLNKISIASNHMMSLVNNILELNKSNNENFILKYEYCSLHEIMEEAKNLLENQLKEKGICLFIDNDKLYNDIIKIDKLKLMQIMLNLLSNAIKYSYNNSIIYLIVSEKSIDNKTSEFEFLIKDNGIGMKEEFLKSVFDTYKRAEEVKSIEGNGLGLSITKDIVSKLGGDIKINSELNKGTEVTVKIKIHISKDKKMKRILIVEDDELNRDLIKEILSTNDYYYEEAVNGKQAYEKVIKSDINYYSLILMDVNLPFISGKECVELIRNIDDKKSEIPIIIMSGNTINEDSIQYKINDFIEKPVSYKKLLKIVSKHIN